MTGSPRFPGAGVMVTGASRGLGRSIAVAFGREGARVALTFRTRESDAVETLRLVVAAGGSGSVHRMDVRDPVAVRAAVAAVEAEGPLDVLVNNAGMVRDDPFLMVSPESWDDVLATNLTGCYHCSRAVLPAMLARRRGAIVNVASVAALRASPGQTPYAASKAGVLSLTKTLAREVAPRGVRVNAVVPGLLSTGMGVRLDRRAAEARTSQIALGRPGTADEVAGAVLFLASDDASYVVGEALTVDGGLSL